MVNEGPRFKVSGIGGVFFRTNDPERLALRYEEKLGVSRGSEHGICEQEAGPTMFAPFPADTDCFDRMDQAFMLNFRIDDLDGMLEQFVASGVKIDPKHEDS